MSLESALPPPAVTGEINQAKYINTSGLPRILIQVVWLQIIQAPNLMNSTNHFHLKLKYKEEGTN